MSVPIFRLDPDGEMPGAALCTERALLEWIVSKDYAGEAVLVQGRLVCHWAAEWASARDLETEAIVSPRASWRRWHPLWSDAEIELLQRQSGLLTAPNSREEILVSLLPNGPFLSRPGDVRHAVEWLLWLEATAIQADSVILPLLRSLTETWIQNLDEGDLLVQHAYSQYHSLVATQFLEEWLLEGRYTPHFPLAVPEKWLERAKAKWKFELIDQGIDKFWASLSAADICLELHQLAAQMVFDYLTHHPEMLTAELPIALKGYLPTKDWLKLNRAIPPAKPQAVSLEASPNWVLKWFRDEYLPFRKWQLEAGDPSAASEAVPVAASFAEWVLRFYPQAVGGGSGYDHLSIAASAQLQQSAGVVLWVILDGLPATDGDLLRDLLQAEKRFSLAEDRLCFTCLPTITCFCKPALMNGSPPDKQEFSETPFPKFAAAVMLRDKTMRDQAAQATEGQVLVWSFKEPDATYHKNQSRETTLEEVAGHLKVIADRIGMLALSMPDNLAVTVVVSTDHGRVLASDLPRQYALPTEAQSEGRAAWAYGNREAANVEGTVVLTADKYRLPANVSVEVACGNGAFVMGNGVAGNVSFPHGGLWPEEVIVPWLTFVRDAKVPSLRIVVSGSGRTGGNGTISVSMTNAETISLNVLELRARSADGRVDWRNATPQMVLPQQTKSFEVEFTPYPDLEGLEEFMGEAIVALPNNVRFTLPVEISLSTDSLYDRGLDARDLLDL